MVNKVTVDGKTTANYKTAKIGKLFEYFIQGKAIGYVICKAQCFKPLHQGGMIFVYMKNLFGIHLKAQNNFGYIEKKENSKNIIGSSNKGTCGYGRINSSFIQNDGYKSTHQGRHHNDEHHRACYG